MDTITKRSVLRRKTNFLKRNIFKFRYFVKLTSATIHWTLVTASISVITSSLNDICSAYRIEVKSRECGEKTRCCIRLVYSAPLAKKKIIETFAAAGALWQRCWFHSIQLVGFVNETSLVVSSVLVISKTSVQANSSKKSTTFRICKFKTNCVFC